MCVCMYVCMYVCEEHRGVMATVLGNGHDDPRSNPGRFCLHLKFC